MTLGPQAENLGTDQGSLGSTRALSGPSTAEIPVVQGNPTAHSLQGTGLMAQGRIGFWRDLCIGYGSA